MRGHGGYSECTWVVEAVTYLGHAIGASSLCTSAFEPFTISDTHCPDTHCPSVTLTAEEYADLVAKATGKKTQIQY